MVDDDLDIDPSRIAVRSYELSDIDDFMSWACDPEICRYTNFKCPLNKEDGLELIEDRKYGHLWYKTICLDQKSIGEVMVTRESGPTCRARIGYVVGRGHWGRGVATHVVKLVSRELFREWSRWLERIDAIVDVENSGSQRVLEKSGFKKEGVLRKFYLLKGIARDMFMYSLLSSDLDDNKS